MGWTRRLQSGVSSPKQWTRRTFRSIISRFFVSSSFCKGFSADADGTSPGAGFTVSSAGNVFSSASVVTHLRAILGGKGRNDCDIGWRAAGLLEAASVDERRALLEE